MIYTSDEISKLNKKMIDVYNLDEVDNNVIMNVNQKLRYFLDGKTYYSIIRNMNISMNYQTKKDIVRGAPFKKYSNRYNIIIMHK